MRLLLCIFITILTLPIAAQAPYGGLIDLHMSPYAGSDNLMLPQKALMKGQDRLSLRSYENDPLWSVERAAELIFLWDALGQLMMVTEHEVFGHGYRIRSLGSYYARVSGYDIDAPFPYGNGGGMTYYFISPRLTATQELAINIAGVEATAILASELKKKWLLDGVIDPRQAALYNYSEHDLTQYILHLSGIPTDPSSSNDMQAYIYWLNTTYPDGNLTENTLKAYALINFLDPITFYSLYSWFNYVFTGENTPIPQITIGSIKWLPNFRLGLTPFGPEVFLENYVTYRKSITYFYLKGGTFAHNHYYGIGIENKNIWSYKEYTFGLRFDGWKQPPYASFLVATAKAGIPSPLETGGERLGTALQFTAYYQIPDTPLSLYAVVGAKTSGFLPGESLYTNPILRLGLYGKL